MNSAYSTVRERTTKSLCSFWEKPVETELIEVDTPANYTDPQVGDFVVVGANGKLRRADSNPTTRPFGLTIGFPPNAEVYPAFGGHYENRALVGVITSNTELCLPFLNVNATTQDGVGSGEYLPANKTNLSIVPGNELGLYYNATTRRWGIGVDFDGNNWVSPADAQPRVRFIRFVKKERYNNPEATNEGDYLFALVQIL